MADVGKAEQDAALQKILAALPEDQGVLLLGSTATPKAAVRRVLEDAGVPT